jgi:hypothetical protein
MGTLEQRLGRACPDAVSVVKAGMELFVNRDGRHALDRHLGALSARRFSEIRTAWRVEPSNLGVSSVCVINPHLDAYRERWSSTRPQPLLTFSMIPMESATHVVVTALPEHEADAARALRAVGEGDDLEQVINLCAFGESEDSCVSPARGARRGRPRARRTRHGA